ncbi:polyprenyl synthetase family protein, partial [Streptomyces spiralis]
MAEFMTETTPRPPGARRAAGTARPAGAVTAGAVAGEPPSGPRAADGGHGDGSPGEARAGTAAPDGHDAAVILDRARACVDPELRSAIASLPSSMRRIARYHFGWEHADGTPATGNAG